MLEAQTTQIAEAAGLPAAHVVFASSDVQWLGGGFFITWRIAGRSDIVIAASGRRVGELEYDLKCLLRPQSR